MFDDGEGLEKIMVTLIMLRMSLRKGQLVIGEFVLESGISWLLGTNNSLVEGNDGPPKGHLSKFFLSYFQIVIVQIVMNLLFQAYELMVFYVYVI